MQLSNFSTQILGCSVLGCGVWILFDKGSFIAVLSFSKCVCVCVCIKIQYNT